MRKNWSLKIILSFKRFDILSKHNYVIKNILDINETEIYNKVRIL